MPQVKGMVGTVPRKSRSAAARPAGTQAIARGNVLHRNAVWLFGIFAVLMLVAFWPSYYSRLDTQPTFHFHAHGMALTVWIGLMVAQAWLMRVGRRATHRSLGRWSYLAAPLVVIATINFAHFRVQVVPVPLDPASLYFLTLVLMALAAFVVLYGLAMFSRRHPQLHARYMIATLFPFVTPVTDRLVGRYAPSLVPMVPSIGGSPVVGVVGFILVDALLVALVLWDWRANKRVDAFAIALAVLVVFHVSVLTFYELPFWIAFGNWFVGLPLS